MRAMELARLLGIVALAVLGPFGCGGGPSPSPIGEARLIDFSNSPDCVRKGAEDDKSGDPPKVEVLTSGLEIEIIHGNATFNCCLDTIMVDLRQEESTILLTEREVVTKPCRCVCPFLVTASLEVSMPGDYRIEIYAAESLIWTGEVTVTGRRN